MRGGPSRGRKTVSIRHSRKVCIECGKAFTTKKDPEYAKRRFSKDETDHFNDEEGSFICEEHRNQLCSDCFRTAVAINNERLAFRRSMDRAVKGIWKRIYLKEGVKVPWSEDEDEDDGAPSDNIQRQTEKAPSSSLSGEKTCAHCGKVGDLDRCAKCKVTFYCSRWHQAADYAKHKENCQVSEDPVNDTAQPTKTTTHAPDSTQQPASSSISKACAHCGATEKLSKCSRCKCTWYCSVEHQRAHYPEHKQECRMIAGTPEIAALESPTVPIDSFHMSKGLFPFNMFFGFNQPAPVEDEDIMPEEARVTSWKKLG